MYVGDDIAQEILRVGDVYIHLPQGDIIRICNVLYISNLKKNLLSIKYQDDNNDDIYTRKKKCTLEDSFDLFIAIVTVKMISTSLENFIILNSTPSNFQAEKVQFDSIDLDTLVYKDYNKFRL